MKERLDRNSEDLLFTLISIIASEGGDYSTLLQGDVSPIASYRSKRFINRTFDFWTTQLFKGLMSETQLKCFRELALMARYAT
jgi:hypothetical protein